MLLFFLACAGFRHHVDIPVPTPPPPPTSATPVVPLEREELSRARDVIVLKLVLPDMLAGRPDADVRVLTGITDAVDVGQENWRSCQEMDGWLLDQFPGTEVMFLSEHHLPCSEDPAGYVTDFLAASFAGGPKRQIPGIVTYGNETMRFQVTEERVVPVDWIVDQ